MDEANAGSGGGARRREEGSGGEMEASGTWAGARLESSRLRQAAAAAATIQKGQRLVVDELMAVAPALSRSSSFAACVVGWLAWRVVVGVAVGSGCSALATASTQAQHTKLDDDDDDDVDGPLCVDRMSAPRGFSTLRCANSVLKLFQNFGELQMEQSFWKCRFLVLYDPSLIF